MPHEAKNSDGVYLYAVIADPEDRTYGDFGIDGGAVYNICDRRTAAVVSDVPRKKLRPERRNLAAHQEVLRYLMQTRTPLPMAFGIIADSREEVRRILVLNREAFGSQLLRVDGKVEMGLRVTWDVPNIFEYFVYADGELRAARDRLLGTHGEPSRDEKIDVGRLFERILNDDRERHTEAVEEILAPRCFEIKRSLPKREAEVMNLACLVGRDTQSKFEEAVCEAAALFDNNFSFDYTGPWAPHNFVEVDLRL